MMSAEKESRFRDGASHFTECMQTISVCVINDRLLRVTLKSSADAALPQKTLESEEGGQTGNASLPDSLWLRTP